VSKRDTQQHVVKRSIRRDHIKHLLHHAIVYSAESLHLDRLAEENRRLLNEQRDLGRFSHFHSDVLMDHLCVALSRLCENYANEERATRQRMEEAEIRLRESLDGVRYHRKTTDSELEFVLMVLGRAREALEAAITRWTAENEHERAARSEKAAENHSAFCPTKQG